MLPNFKLSNTINVIEKVILTIAFNAFILRIIIIDKILNSIKLSLRIFDFFYLSDGDWCFNIFSILGSVFSILAKYKILLTNL